MDLGGDGSDVSDLPRVGDANNVTGARERTKRCRDANCTDEHEPKEDRKEEGEFGYFEEEEGRFRSFLSDPSIRNQSCVCAGYEQA